MNVVVLTGAGISQESGIPTFRGVGGLWEGHKIEEVASPEGFAANPQLVHRFYNLRRKLLQDSAIQPNAAHLALADFERRWTAGRFCLITQNIDNLHQRAGSKNVIAMHGELLKARCMESGEVFSWHGDLTEHTPHPKLANRPGRLRPHVVWFGEIPLHLPEIESALYECDLFAAIGTSGKVYPAAGFVMMVPPQCRKVEMNAESTPVGPSFDVIMHGPASIEVPKFFGKLLEAHESAP